MARLTAIVVVALLVLLPGTASGADVSLSYAGRAYIQTDHGIETRAGYEIVFTAASGEANRLSMTELDDGEAYRIEDAGATLNPGNNCTADGDAVVCRIPPPPDRGVAWLEADLGDGDDQTLTPIHGEVHGGPGDDVLAADGIVDGGSGGDRMTGTGAGRLSYAERNTGVNVTFDGLANDGEPGEGDDVRGTFGVLYGGAGNDVLEASGAPSWTSFFHAEVYGFDGEDRLIGSPERDWLSGGRGDDVLEGGDGDDQLIGGADADRTRGGAGSDTWDSGFHGSPNQHGVPTRGITITPDDHPNDGFRGEGDDVGSDIENYRTGPGPGDDHITGTRAANRIDSGGGDDTIVPLGGRDVIASEVGTGDTLRLRDGERDRARCSVGGFPLIAADAGDDLARCASEVRFSPRSLSLRASRTGTTILRARCARRTGAPCTGTLRLYEGGSRRVLASGRYRIRPNATEAVRVHVTHTGGKLLRRHGRIRFVATATPDGRRLASTAVHARGTLRAR